MTPDLVQGLLRDGYDAVGLDRERRTGDAATDTYVSRLLGRRALVVRGHAGARLFYDETVVRRKGAVPFPLRGLLFGPGAVHGLDGEQHRERKHVFLELLEPGHAAGLALRSAEVLQRRVAGWAGREVVVFDELVEVYGEAVIAWAGLACERREVRRMSREMARIVAGFGSVGGAHARGWQARLRVDRWARRHVREARAGDVRVAEGTVLGTLARTDLDEGTAAVELVNVLRPTIAVAWLGAFAVLDLDEAPAWRQRLAVRDTGRDHVAFAQEVRRSSPFVPVLAGRALREVRHEGQVLHAGDALVLDVWGTDQDPALWRAPEVFDPERFLGGEPGIFDFLPQGGGEPEGHRCPGEPVAVRLLADTVRTVSHLPGKVTSSHHVDLSRIPALPEAGTRWVTDSSHATTRPVSSEESAASG